MTSGNKGGRPRGIVLVTNARSGAYSTAPQLPNVLKFWKKYKPGNARRCEDIIKRYLRQMGWNVKHERYNEIRDLGILTVSRSELFMLIIEKNFRRDVFDKVTGHFVKSRPSDQFRKLEQLDDDIQLRLKKLGIIKIKE